MLKKGRQPTFGEEVWNKVDWNLKPTEIAKAVGCSLSRVYVWAEKLGKQVKRVPPGPKPKINWSMVDWSKSNKELIAETGCTPSWVRRQRQKYVQSTKENANG